MAPSRRFDTGDQGLRQRPRASSPKLLKLGFRLISETNVPVTFLRIVHLAHPVALPAPRHPYALEITETPKSELASIRRLRPRPPTKAKRRKCILPRLVPAALQTGIFSQPGTEIQHREAAGKAADHLSNFTTASRVTSIFPHVRKGTVAEAFPNAFLGVCLDDDVHAEMPKPHP